VSKDQGNEKHDDLRTLGKPKEKAIIHIRETEGKGNNS
jgi:hypothetical protein